MTDFLLSLFNKPISGIMLLIAPTIFLAYFASLKIKVIPWPIWCFIIGSCFVEIELVESIRFDHIVTEDLLSLAPWFIGVAMFQIGLEATIFTYLRDIKFWALIFMIIAIPGTFIYLFLGFQGIELVGTIALNFTSSLAVVAVFINLHPKLFDHPLIKKIMITGVTTDVILWIIVGFLDIIRKEGTLSIESATPQILVLIIFIFAIYTGIKYWWDKFELPSVVWLVTSIIFAEVFNAVGFNLLLGTIFTGMLVPNNQKHEVSKELDIVFRIAMLAYMASVPYKQSEPLNLEALYYALEFILITTSGKYLAIRFSGFFDKKHMFVSTILLGNPGTMGIAAASVMAHAHIISENIFMAMSIEAVVYTVLAGIILEKYLPGLLEEVSSDVQQELPNINIADVKNCYLISDGED
jgi:Kef-type K+ transport system membrane component KefB